MRLADQKSKAGKLADKIYKDLLAEGYEVLYDERVVSAGEKFADADLLGLPYRLVVGDRNGEKLRSRRETIKN